VTSFKTDIAPMLAPYRANMMWRFDITDYDTVSQNAQMIYGRLSGTTGTQMPPPLLDALPQSQIDLFALWIKEGCPK
jgi:hypothetical protein